jgi:flavin-binding protein dodecin
VGIERANKTLENITSAWIKDQEVVVHNGKMTEYKVRMKVTFVLKE